MTDAVPPTPTSSRRLPPWMPLVVVAVAWLAQGAVLRNGWVWDDAVVVRDGRAVAEGLAAVPSMLQGSWARGEGIEVGLFRPLVGVTLAVQAQLHGTADPFPFHLLNLFLHGCVAVALLALLHRLLPTRPVVSSSAALLFAVHPLHTGTVSWIVARGDLLAALCSLLAALAWTRPRGRDAAAVVLASVAWFLALLSKEAALAVPAVLLVVDVAATRAGVLGTLRARWRSYAALALTLVAWGALRWSSGAADALAANAPLAGRPLLERMLVAAGALVRMAGKLAVPAGLTGDASDDPLLVSRTADLPGAYAVAAAVLGLATIALVVGVVRRRAGLAAACATSFALLALPTLQLVPIGAAFEDRFAYLPSLAFLPLAGLAAERVLALRPRVVGLCVALLPLAAAVPAAWAAAADWRDEPTFDRALLDRNPAHWRALDRLGRHLLLEGVEARRAAAALPGREKARIDALLERRRARVEEAVSVLERAKALPGGATRPAILRSLGDAYASLPEPEHGRAREAYERWLDVKRVLDGDRRVPVASVDDPARVAWAERRSVSQVYDNLAISFRALEPDDLAGLARLLDGAARWNDRSFDLARRAAAAWLLAKDPVQAMPHLERAVRLAARDRTVSAEDRLWAEQTAADTRPRASRDVAGAMARGYDALLRTGGHRVALEEFREAVRLEPTHAEAHVEIAKLLRYQGNFRGALEALDLARQALDQRGGKPDDPLRARVAELVRRYTADRDAPEDGR